MSTYGSGMWNAFRDSDTESNMIGDAIAQTEREIFEDAMDIVGDDDTYDSSPEDLEDISGETHDNDTWFSLNPDGSSDESEPQPQQHYRQPEPEQEIDLFADPEARLQQHVRQLAERQYGQPIPATIGTPVWNGPDIFAEPERALQHAAYMGAELANQARFHEERFNSSLAHAADTYGSEFSEAWNAIVNLDPRVPGNQQMAHAIWSAPDPGAAVLEVYGAMLGRDRVNRMMGGPGMLPRRQTNYAERSLGMHYEAPTTDEGRIEEAIFNSAWD